MAPIGSVKQFAYSVKTLFNGIYKAKPRNFIRMRTVSLPENVVDVPLSCFTKTKSGDIVLYRGFKNSGLVSETVSYEKSVAASIGQTISDVLAGIGKRTKRNIKSLANCFSGLTQGGDPILHTTTKYQIARRFAGDGGTVVRFHIPKKFLARRGMVGHLGENEIDFFYSIPKKYIAKVTAVRHKPVTMPIQKGQLASPPAFISIV